MNIQLDATDLRPLIQQVVAETLERLEAERAEVDGCISAPEAKAAALIGVERHVLRDARLRGEVEASRVGKKVVYQREQLLKLLEKNRITR